MLCRGVRQGRAKLGGYDAQCPAALKAQPAGLGAGVKQGVPEQKTQGAGAAGILASQECLPRPIRSPLT